MRAMDSSDEVKTISPKRALLGTMFSILIFAVVSFSIVVVSSSPMNARIEKLVGEGKSITLMALVPNTPSVFDVAVMVAVPKLLPMAIPPLVTSITVGLLDVQVNVLSVVVSGNTVAVNRLDEPR